MEYKGVNYSRYLLAFAILAFIAFATLSTLSPLSLRPDTGNALLERWAAFAVFGALLGLGYPKAAWQSMLFALLAIIGLEVLQRFVPGRHGQIEDAFIKSIGAISGIGFVLVVDFVLKLRAR